jgi:large subunit ribosomal protein L15
MKLHDLRPAEGSRKDRTRVGRGIAAGKGKTAGRGTKGQKARAGGSIPPWFEGGQTPLHMRIPKLRGFRNRFKVDYEVVNIGDIARALEAGRIGGETPKRGKTAGPITVNQDLLKDAGLIRTLDKPMKVLGDGELTTALFVVADAFTRSARAKIEAAGGSVNVLEVPTKKSKALGVEAGATGPAPTATEPEAAADEPPAKARRGKAAPAEAVSDEATTAEAPAPEAEAPEAEAPEADLTVAEAAEPADADPEPEAVADAEPAVAESDEPAEAPAVSDDEA